MTTLLKFYLVSLTLLFSQLAADRAAAMVPNSSEISGGWSSDCRRIASDVYQTELYRFTLSRSYHHEIKLFTRDDCDPITQTETKVYEGTYQFSGQDPRAKGRPLKIDFVINRVFESAEDRDTATKFKSAKFCDITNWAVGEQRDVTGKNCDGDSILQGTSSYDLLAKKSSNLYFGKESFFADVANREERPAQIDKSVKYHHVE